jgi:hypothetical protein
MYKISASSEYAAQTTQTDYGLIVLLAGGGPRRFTMDGLFRSGEQGVWFKIEGQELEIIDLFRAGKEGVWFAIQGGTA